MRFTEGDKVIINVPDSPEDGVEGEVIEVDEEDPDFQYSVRWEDPNEQSSHTEWFSEEELEETE